MFLLVQSLLKPHCILCTEFPAICATKDQVRCTCCSVVSICLAVGTWLKLAMYIFTLTTEKFGMVPKGVHKLY